MKQKILVIDDERDLCEILRFNLASAGFVVHTAYSGEEALLKDIPSYDLLLLDVMMPGMSGFELAARLKQDASTADVPIIFLTALNEEENTLHGFDLGADDYITKPFSAMALLMRVRAIFRRIDVERMKHASDVSASVTVGNLVLDEDRRQILGNSQALALSPTEYEVLKYLMLHKDQAVSREELLNAVWGFDTAVETRATDDTVRRLRQKLDGCGVSIAAVWGFGFRLIEDK